MAKISIVLKSSGEVLAQGQLGTEIRLFEGNYYAKSSALKSTKLRCSYIPGICFYKFIYVWFHVKDEQHSQRWLAWLYILPNPLFPALWFRVGFAGYDERLEILREEDL
ncbi:hypothetical protein [Pleionea sp. CnH1-48]|uniref:hypothetical protein n=1 Tax=Pleionea sp. CnH1-48 TaxID=2954494 RepID=UPI002097DFC6|nr:hypothetical protein [Pleionea sp. CnH1-48]MCO7227249.1 hypothetical protein [Pleionea sp. CnH1-48]